MLAAAILLPLVSCATGPAFQEAPAPGAGQSLLYLMRPVVVGGSFWNTKFSVNGTHVVTLTNEGYSWVVLNAGTYEISTQLLKNEPLRIKIVLQPGRTHYVEVRESEAAGATSISYTRRDLLHEIPANTARPRLEKMKYTPASESTASASQ